MKQKNSKKYKQILSVLLSLFTVFTLFPALTTQLPTAEAGTYGKFEYEIQDGEVTITDYPETATGAVTIPSKIKGYPVTSIKNNAFICCHLTSITIPDSVTSIGEEAFQSCGLKTVTIGNSVTSIGARAFYYCTELTSVTIGNSVTSIGDSAFDDTAYYNNSANWENDVLYIGKYLITAKFYISGSYTIKSGTKCIAEDAFSYRSGLTSITIPESVTSIGDYAFSGCTGLTSIIIPDSVTSIGMHAFDDTAYCNNPSNWKNSVLYIGNHLIKANGDITGSYTIKSGTRCIAGAAFESCYKLTKITIPSSVTSIDNYAFSGCTGLTSITIPDSVTSIGDWAFSGCTGLESITVSSKNTVYHSAGNCLIATKSKTLILGCKNSVIPADGSVTSINNHAFYGCAGLKSIAIPDSVTSIGEEAFYGCTGLTSITIPNSVESIGEMAFYSCRELSSVKIGNGVTSIGDEAFVYCEGLTSINIPGNVKSIGDSAFSICYGLTSITIGNSVTSIGDDAFYGCSGLESITVSSKNTVYHSTGNCLIETESKTLILGCKNSVIPADGSVTSINNHAFYGCAGLKSIAIPDSVTSIGFEAFCGCSGLTSITIGKRVEGIGFDAFRYCDRLTSIDIPDSVTSIGQYAFSECIELASITIGNGLTSIGIGAFDDTAYYNNSSNWENGVLYIGKYLIDAKEDISGSYTIKSGTKCIAKEAFRGRTGLTSITIPDSVKSIGYCAFYGCNGLASIKIGNSVTSIGSGAFYNTAYSDDSANWENGVLYIGKYLINADGNIISGSYTIKSGTKCIADAAFAGCIKLTSITIPNTVTNIGYCAFYCCQGLESITIGSSVTSIGYDAFYNTAYYNNSSNWKNGVLYIGKYLIAVKQDITGNCTIKSGTKCIANYAFDRCTGLTSITIPDSVTIIGKGAFSNCYGCGSLIGCGVELIDYDIFPIYFGNLVIYGYSGSYAEKYAKKYKLEFNAIENIPLAPGDPDGDGDITAADARFALRLSVGLENYKKSSAEYTASDIDGDGSVTAADARLILRGAVGLENTSKWGK